MTQKVICIVQENFTQISNNIKLRNNKHFVPKRFVTDVNWYLYGWYSSQPQCSSCSFFVWLCFRKEDFSFLTPAACFSVLTFVLVTWVRFSHHNEPWRCSVYHTWICRTTETHFDADSCDFFIIGTLIQENRFFWQLCCCHDSKLTKPPLCENAHIRTKCYAAYIYSLRHCFLLLLLPVNVTGKQRQTYCFPLFFL